LRSDIELIPLQEQMKSRHTELLQREIERFTCAKDADVESFLKEKAVRYERDGLSRTYLYVIGDEDNAAIAAFFSVAITSTEFPGVTKSRKAKILGGKVVYLDCREPLIGFYEQNGYALVKPEPYPSGYFKMFKSLHKL